MRFMMLMMPDAYQGDKGCQEGTDFTPSPEAVNRMMKYNEELAKAGVLISLDGLHPPLTGAFVSFPGGKPIVTEGCYVESRNVLGGYWMIQVKSREEALEWAKRIPADEGDVVEVRRIFESSEFPEDVQKAAVSPAVEAQPERHRRLSCCT